MLGPDEYDQKYRSLSHTYYRREWFAQRTGANVRSLEVFDGCVPNYAPESVSVWCNDEN